jgi:putative transposase
MWRCHNKEYYLRSQKIKSLYMQTIKESLKTEVTSNNIKIHAYCVMDNHYHQAVSYKESSQYLSRFMRHAHSLFGARYNRINHRSGKVAEARPKTSLIENSEHEMRVHFYIEANPVRAGICKPENLRTYKFNSFKFYAYGIKDEYTHLLTIPEWYMELGKTPHERQKKYRKLFYEYLEENKSSSYTLSNQQFIGSIFWKLKQEERVSLFLKAKSENSC